MSDQQHAVNIVCDGQFKRVPIPNQYLKIEKLKDIICDRFQIDYPINLTYEGAQLCNQDSLHDLALKSNNPIHVRRCSIDPYITDLMTDIFLSYEQTDRENIIQLNEKLKQKNYFSWLDLEQIPDKNQFSPAIEQGIKKSTVFICCINRKYITSNKCQQELTCAKRNNKPIIILLMEQMSWPPPQIRNLVLGLSYIEFYYSSTSWSVDKFDELISILADLAPNI